MDIPDAPTEGKESKAQPHSGVMKGTAVIFSSGGMLVYAGPIKGMPPAPDNGLVLLQEDDYKKLLVLLERHEKRQAKGKH